MSDLKILAWDVERVPALGYHWGLFQQNISLSQLVLPGETVSFAARWIGQPKKDAVFYSTYHNGKQPMLDALWKLHDEADALLSWNGQSFDTRHANTEFVLAGMTPPSPSAEIDLLRTAKKRFKFLSNKLDFVAQELGVGKKIGHEGFDLWKKVIAREPAAWERFKRYNLQDVHLLVDLYDRLKPWIVGHPNVNLFGGQGCPKCGSSKLEKRGHRRTVVGVYQRYCCQQCGAWSSSGKSVELTDIREVK